MIRTGLYYIYFYTALSCHLLSLYLPANCTNPSPGPAMSCTSSKVDFVPNTARPQPSMPADLSKEEFLSRDDVQATPLPRGQVGVVMTSYDKTIGAYV